MHKHKNSFLLGAIASVILLNGCGGSGGAGSGTQTINGISVPPEPDTATNNATLAGVDSNSNGVRDDVERRLAEKSINQLGFDANISIAKEYQSALLGDENTAASAIRNINCLASASANSIATSDISKIIVDNPERKSSMRAATLNATGGFINIESDCK